MNAEDTESANKAFISVLKAINTEIDLLVVPEVTSRFPLANIRGLLDQESRVRVRSVISRFSSFEQLKIWIISRGTHNFVHKDVCYEYYFFDKNHLAAYFIIHKAFNQDIDSLWVNRIEDWFVVGPDLFSSGIKTFRQWMLHNWLCMSHSSMLGSPPRNLEHLLSRME